MRKKILHLLFGVLIFGILIFLFFQGDQKAQAGSEHNVSGWAWSNMENDSTPESEATIGWISFNSINCDGNDDGLSDGTPVGCPPAGQPIPSYGVHIDGQGRFLGYAYHDLDDPATPAHETGWISFYRSDTGAPPGPPNYGTHLAQVNLENGDVSGWARALAYGDNWDGWIKFRKDPSDGGVNYGVYIDKDDGEFHGWAWGSSDVIGWISFSGTNYAVMTSFDFNDPPVAQMSCDASSCLGGQCDGTWMAYRPTADPTPCIYTINNDSTDPDSTNPPENNNDIKKSRWFLSDVLKRECDGVCDYTITSDVAAGEYTLRLEVEDFQGATNLIPVTHPLTIKNDAWAEFQCSVNGSDWVACESLSGTVTQGDTIYVDGTSSTASDGGGPISFWGWMLNGVPFGNSSPTASVELIYTSNTIRLTIANRTDYQEYTISTKLPLPEWTEIVPL